MATESGTVTIEARPEPIAIHPARTAVIVVDMQNDFGSRSGMFDRAGIDISSIQQVVAPIAGILSAARDAGIKVIYIKMEHREDLSDAGAMSSPHRIKHLRMALGERISAPGGGGRVLVRDSWNTRILDELTPEDGDIIVSKTRYSAFYQTELDTILKTLGITHLIITGCTTSVCVESTVRDAMFRDYSCIVLEDCTAEPIGADLPRSNHEATLLVIQLLFGWVSSSDDVKQALSEITLPQRSATPTLATGA